MYVHCVTIQCFGTKEQFDYYKTHLNSEDSPIGKLPDGFRLAQRYSRGPESEPSLAFTLEYWKPT